MHAERRIEIRSSAPPKPALGAPCNGCGVCCLAEPCPVGMLVSRRRHGACTAVLWDAAQSRYLCGMVVQPGQYLPLSLRWLTPLWQRWSRRFIAAGIGCDCDIEVD